MLRVFSTGSKAFYGVENFLSLSGLPLLKSDIAIGLLGTYLIISSVSEWE